jgi:UTP--glucose-1-phosphate uridylyltransferase
MVGEGVSFVMEVARRTAMDRRGGHLARLADGRYVLRESAQCPEEDMAAFQDIDRHRYFNTNNLWLDLSALKEALERESGVLPLPLIVNPKTLNPRDPSSPKIFQLETAMGAAISVFDRVGAVVVPRSRFCPVKKCSDLLNVWSDRYVLGSDYRVTPSPDAAGAITIDLDSSYYTRLADFQQRFPHGAPSLLACTNLKVTGDVTFGAGVTCVGDVTVEAAGNSQARVSEGQRLEGSVVL